MAADLNNNLLPSSAENILGEPEDEAETPVRLSLDNGGNLRLFNPNWGSWIWVKDLNKDKQAYLFHSLARKASSGLRDILDSVRGPMAECLKVLKFGSSIPLKSESESRPGDEVRVYANGQVLIRDELEGFGDVLRLYLENCTRQLSLNSDTG
jgi:hypothetical protein